MKNALLLLLFLSVSTFSIAQSTVRGTVNDEKNKSLEFANVLLFNLSDSTLQKGALSDAKGKFILENIPDGAYYLEVNLLGFTPQFIAEIKVDETQKELELPTISLSENATLLEAVTVKAKKPFLEQKAGKMIVNVDAQITGQNGSLMDLMKKVPGVIVMNGQLRMAGRPNVTIFIDGRPTQYMDIDALLREMPADNIARIEVISQPDASFEASGTGGVINIILKKNVLLGTNGSVRLGVGYGELAKYRASGRLNYRDAKWNLYAGAGFAHRSYVERMDLDRKVLDQSFTQSNYEPSKPYSYGARVGADHYINDRHTVGIMVRGNYSTNDRINENRSGILDLVSRDTLLTFKTENELKRKWWYLNTDLFYTFDIDTTGQQLNVSANLTGYDRQATSYVKSTALSGEPIDFPDTGNEVPSIVNIQAYSVDYKYPFNESTKLQVGAKYSRANIDGDLQAWTLENGIKEPNMGLSNHFILDETIYAGYANLNFNFNKIEVAAGLRYENTRSEGNSLTLDSVTTRKYDQFFPSLSVNIPINDALGVALAYSYRINRPNYSNLNPFVYVMDPYTYQQGNPQLRPELTHSAKASLTYESQPFFNLEYNRTSDAMLLVTSQNDMNGIAFGETVNLDAFTQIGGSLFAPLNFAKPFDGYAGVMVYYNKYESQYLGDTYNGSQVSFTGFLQLNTNFGDGWSAEVGGFYTGKGVEGIMTFKPMYSMSFGVQKKFWNNNATIELSVDDFMYRFWRGNITYQNMDMDILSSWETKVVNLSFTYKFGNQHLKSLKSRRSSGADENNRATVQD